MDSPKLVGGVKRAHGAPRTSAVDVAASQRVYRKLQCQVSVEVREAIESRGLADGESISAFIASGIMRELAARGVDLEGEWSASAAERERFVAEREAAQLADVAERLAELAADEAAADRAAERRKRLMMRRGR